MAFSGRTHQIRSSAQRSSRAGTRIDSVILHHQAGTNDDSVINAMVSGSRQVSSNYTVSNEGRITGVVDEGDRAWTSGSSSDGGRGAAWDKRSITFEIENESAGGAWPVSAVAHEAVAQMVADVSARYGFDINRDRVVGHRELWTRHKASYPTACPGGLNIDAVVSRAREIRGLGVAPVGTIGGTGAPAGPNAGVMDGQRLLNAVGYKLAVDGINGPATKAAVRDWQSKHGLEVDGIIGPITAASLRGAPAAPAGGLAVDGDFGPATKAALQRALGVTADGVIGPQTLRAQQARTGATVDGIDGPNTRRALQRHLGVAQDGIVGPATIRALQARLNAGSF